MKIRLHFSTFYREQNQYDSLNTHAKHGPTSECLAVQEYKNPGGHAREPFKEILHERANGFELLVKDGLVIKP